MPNRGYVGADSNIYNVDDTLSEGSLNKNNSNNDNNNGDYTQLNVQSKMNNQQDSQIHIGNVFNQGKKKLQNTNWMGVWLAAISELLGLTLIIVIGAATVGGTFNIVASAFAFGMSLVLAMVVFGMFSGGHFNPGTTFALWVFGHIDWVTMLFYIFAQLVASFLAALLLILIFGSGSTQFERTATIVDPSNSGDYSAGNALVVELLGSMILTMTVLRLTYFRVGLVLSALLLGFAFTGLELFGLIISGASFNIFRTLGIAIISGIYAPFVAASWWVYPVGHVGGVIIAIILEAILRWMKNARDRQMLANQAENDK